MRKYFTTNLHCFRRRKSDTGTVGKLTQEQEITTILFRLFQTQQNSANVADAVYQWIRLGNKLPQSVTDDAYYKKQRGLGMLPVSIAAYLLHPKYKGLGQLSCSYVVMGNFTINKLISFVIQVMV